jgi:hypothetical protein
VIDIGKEAKEKDLALLLVVSVAKNNEIAINFSGNVLLGKLLSDHILKKCSVDKSQKTIQFSKH